MNRDFKGVWIPKEIWLNEELTLLEKIIFVEIDSLDNENHCIAGNEYFAEFCNCSESKVSKAIKKLKELGMIEELSFDGRHRKIRVVKSTMESSKKYDAESQNLQSNNTDNNITNKEKVVSKDTTTEFQFGSKQSKPKKENLYSKCIQLIDSYDFSCWGHIREQLIDYLNFRLSVKDKPLYANMWKGMLNKLVGLCVDDISKYEQVIQYSLERGYLSFYEPNNFSSDIKSKPWEQGVTCEAYTKEELEAEQKDIQARLKRGERVYF